MSDRWWPRLYPGTRYTLLPTTTGVSYISFGSLSRYCSPITPLATTGETRPRSDGRSEVRNTTSLDVGVEGFNNAMRSQISDDVDHLHCLEQASTDLATGPSRESSDDVCQAIGPHG
ncbi:hypothetical protein DICA0_E20802 [Diutina catenulata]